MLRAQHLTEHYRQARMIIHVGSTPVENEGSSGVVHGRIAPGNAMRLIQNYLSIKPWRKIQRRCRFAEALAHQTVHQGSDLRLCQVTQLDEPVQQCTLRGCQALQVVQTSLSLGKF
jgi:hypothetical protein